MNNEIRNASFFGLLFYEPDTAKSLRIKDSPLKDHPTTCRSCGDQSNTTPLPYKYTHLLLSASCHGSGLTIFLGRRSGLLLLENLLGLLLCHLDFLLDAILLVALVIIVLGTVLGNVFVVYLLIIFVIILIVGGGGGRRDFLALGFWRCGGLLVRRANDRRELKTRRGIDSRATPFTSSSSSSSSSSPSSSS